MKTAVIYARYSSTNQTEQSIEGQVHVCEDYAKRNNIIIVDSYIDRAISGTTDERESFQKMLKDSNNKKRNYVLVYKLDRFARNKYEAAIHRKHLKDNGIKLLSAMENIPETPEGVLLESLLEGMNQYFSEELAQKVSRGLHESRMKGHCIGSVPYGYIKENKKLSINKEEAETLTRIYKDYANGKTILQICRDLESENITNKGQKFIPQTIRHFLQRKLYTSEYEINGKQYNNIYPQIITKELFENVKTRMDKNRYGCRKDNHEIQCPEKCFELFIKFVRVYENKIEIGINYAVNTANNNEPIIEKVFTETYTTERNYKGNKIKTTIRTYDVYVVI